MLSSRPSPGDRRQYVDIGDEEDSTRVLVRPAPRAGYIARRVIVFAFGAVVVCAVLAAVSVLRPSRVAPPTQTARGTGAVAVEQAVRLAETSASALQGISAPPAIPTAALKGTAQGSGSETKDGRGASSQTVDAPMMSGSSAAVVPQEEAWSPDDDLDGGISTYSTEAPMVYSGDKPVQPKPQAKMPARGQAPSGRKPAPIERPRPIEAAQGQPGQAASSPPSMASPELEVRRPRPASSSAPEAPLSQAEATAQGVQQITEQARRSEREVVRPQMQSPSQVSPPTDGEYLKPLESRHDGNVCDTEEEEWGGLCYRQCALLTQGLKPVRKGPWTCCNNQPCDNVKQVAERTFLNPLETAKMCLGHCDGAFGSSVICNGYDISGDGSCPHKPGACLTDEELHLGVCYKKCSVLTDGQYPFRSAAATCCKTQGELGCMKEGAALTSPGFNIGGGKKSHLGIHPPDQALTESSKPLKTQLASSEDDVEPEKPEDVKPDDALHDGNVCGDTEEEYLGLCYRKCSLLTNGEAGVRTSAWTCCKDHPCGISNEIMAPGGPMFCHGFGVSEDGSCPHKPGACLEDEEIHGGLCYKKCTTLTGGKFPHRFSAIECCDTTGLGCLMPSHVKLSKAFAMGGGAGDGDKSTPAEAHAPMESLTEAVTDGKGDGRRSDGDDELPQGDLPELWQVAVDGRVNVRRRPDGDALVIDVKKTGAIIRGRRHGNWLQLQDQAGFMMISFKAFTLLKKVNAASTP